MRWAVIPTLVLMIGCSEAVPESVYSAKSESAQLRKPDVRFEPTPQRVVHQMLRLAQVGPGDIVYDLGSGDGRIPITAAKDYGARGVGIDIDPRRIAEANANATEAVVTENVMFRNEDVLLVDFREATVVTLFLSSDFNRKLKGRLLSELRPGTRVVSYYHAMPDWRPQKVVHTGDGTIFLWTVPSPDSTS